MLFIGVQSLVFAQTPQRIHDLKSLTDSSGTDHLFYRIDTGTDDSDSYTNHVYHYNSKTGQEKVLILHYGNSWTNNRVLDYKFLDNDPGNYVYIHNSEEYTFISRSDSTEIAGGFYVTMDHLTVEGTNNGRVYVEVNGGMVIGRNGGRDWPKIDIDSFDEIPDSSRLAFPLRSLSPYDDSLMFGIDYTFGSDNNGFYRSIDQGITKEFISDSLYGSNIQYDSNGTFIYLIDTIGAPGSDVNCSLEQCKYGLYISSTKGEQGSWSLVKVFKGHVHIQTHSKESGKLYVWNSDSVLASNDYGEHFEVLIDPQEKITGFTATDSSIYYTTISTLYELKDGQSTELLSIPVSNETPEHIPTQHELLQNYPNPFNPVTTISFKMKQPDIAKIELYNIQGQKIKDLVNEHKMEGTHIITLDGSDLSSGTYIIQAKLGGQLQTQFISLIK
ncbi:Por secretion system C-terminal sorting domain-containing protein [Gracilimonas mengyeensis]|uniref:Por secretion system C-terminal sorting domain-containing protein n=1 Tax=Gracilimonas mengyeensis TaxID=1302730 RepID=A0A521CGZ3_9BACT|nr:Por secretion system C-terminal sorting domain-containing protein [Gracilimonas mengyeensis]